MANTAQKIKPGRGGTLLLALAAGLAASGAAYVAVRHHPVTARATIRTATPLRPKAQPAANPRRIARLAIAKPKSPIPPSQRALSIRLDPTGGVSEEAKAGDRVDVLATFARTGGQSITRTILQNVALLSVNAAEQKASVIVSPSAAQTLAQAQARGHLQLALRPPSDQSVVAMPALQSEPENKVVTPQRKEAPRPAIMEEKDPIAEAPSAKGDRPPTAATITVVKGTQRETVVVRP